MQEEPSRLAPKKQQQNDVMQEEPSRQAPKQSDAMQEEPDPVLVQGFSLTIIRSDMNTLLGHLNWLNDKVCNLSFN